MEKLLTVAVPAYNADWCIEKCLSSFVDEGVISALEVIVVNDGSTDSTAEIAAEFAARYPDTFRVINKANGGHGSGINVAIAHAKGKYFKVVDADDWVITQNLAPYLKYLSENTADVVLTHYHTVDMATGLRQEYTTRGVPLNEVMDTEAYAAYPGDALQCATFHGITYLTEFCRGTGIVMPEKVFYEDQEYSTLPFSHAKTILPLDIFLYQYMIGNSAQSVSDANQVKHKADIERAALNAAGWLIRHKAMPEGAKRIIMHKYRLIARSYYVVALIKNPNRKQGREDAVRLRLLLSERSPVLVKCTDRDYNIIRLMHFLHISSNMMLRMKRSAIFKFAYRVAKFNWKRKL